MIAVLFIGNVATVVVVITVLYVGVQYLGLERMEFTPLLHHAI